MSAAIAAPNTPGRRYRQVNSNRRWLSRPLIKCRRQFATKRIRTVAIRPARPSQAAKPDDLPNQKGELTDRDTGITSGPFEGANHNRQQKKQQQPPTAATPIMQALHRHRNLDVKQREPPNHDQCNSNRDPGLSRPPAVLAATRKKAGERAEQGQRSNSEPSQSTEHEEPPLRPIDAAPRKLNRNRMTFIASPFAMRWELTGFGSARTARLRLFQIQRPPFRDRQIVMDDVAGRPTARREQVDRAADAHPKNQTPSQPHTRFAPR